MRLILHHEVCSDIDIDNVMEYYEKRDISELAGEFYEELHHCMLEADETPESY